MTGNLTEIALELNRESRFDNMPRVIFITDNGAQPYPEDVIERLPKNSMVILRDYDLTLDQANEIIMAARAHWFDDEDEAAEEEASEAEAVPEAE